MRWRHDGRWAADWLKAFDGDESIQGPWWRRWQEVSWLLIFASAVLAVGIGLGRQQLESTRADSGSNETLLLPAEVAAGVDPGLKLNGETTGRRAVSMAPTDSEDTAWMPGSVRPLPSTMASSGSSGAQTSTSVPRSTSSANSWLIRSIASTTAPATTTSGQESTTARRPTSVNTTSVVATPTTSASTTTTAPTTTSTSASTTTSTTVPTTTTTQWLGPVPRNDYIAGDDDKDLKPKVLENDSAGSSPLDEDSLTIVVPPANADSYRVHDDHIHYRSVKGFSGVDQIRYQICDEAGRCAQAVVVFEIDG